MLKKIGYIDVRKYDIDKVAQILAAMAYDYGYTVEEMSAAVASEAQRFHASYAHNEFGEAIWHKVVINEIVSDRL